MNLLERTNNYFAYIGNGTVDAAKYVGRKMADNATAITLAALAAVLPSCAQYLDTRDLKDQAARVETLSAPLKPALELEKLSAKINTDEIPATLPPVYDTQPAKSALDADDFATLDRVIDSLTYMRGIRERNLQPHLAAKHFTFITDKEGAPKYNEIASQKAEDYRRAAARALKNGYIEGEMLRLRTRISSLDKKDPLKSELETRLKEFHGEAERQMYDTLVSIAALRAAGIYDREMINFYGTLARATSNIDPSSLGQLVLEREGITIDSSKLEKTAKTFGDYRVRTATHEAREKLSALLDSDKINQEQYWSAVIRIVELEEQALRTVPPPEIKVNWLDILPLFGLARNLYLDAPNAFGYKGINPEEIEKAVGLVLATLMGRADEINTSVEAHREKIAVAGVSTAVGGIISYTTGGAGNANGAATTSVGRVGTVLTGGNSGRTGGPAFR